MTTNRKPVLPCITESLSPHYGKDEPAGTWSRSVWDEVRAAEAVIRAARRTYATRPFATGELLVLGRALDRLDNLTGRKP